MAPVLDSAALCRAHSFCTPNFILHIPEEHLFKAYSFPKPQQRTLDRILFFLGDHTLIMTSIYPLCALRVFCFPMFCLVKPGMNG